MNRVLATAPSLAKQAARQLVPCQRTLSTSNFRCQERVDITKLKQAQKQFQIDDGTPIYLKGGLRDRVLFGVTAAMCIFGLGYSLNLIYSMSVPPKN